MNRPEHPVATWLKGHVEATAELTTRAAAVRRGDVFFAYPGARFDGRAFVDDAIERGAAAVVREAAGASRWTNREIAYCDAAGLKASCGMIAADWYQRPSAVIPCVAVTGTSGKTSCSIWIAACLNQLGRSCAVAGTLGMGFLDAFTDTGLTTPDPVALQRGLHDLVDAGATAFVMEASSVGLEEGRIEGMEFDAALFTNLSHDHLDYHGTMANYEKSKQLLFKWPGLRFAIVNVDDAAGVRIAGMTRAQGIETLGFSALGAPQAELAAHRIRQHSQGMSFDIVGSFETISIRTPLVGAHNVDNLLGVFGTLLALGALPEEAGEAIRALQPVAGRLEAIPHGDGPLVLVDYAHKPDALEKVLQACRLIAQERNGRLVVVFGCGGDRDRAKRPVMGEIAGRLADVVVVTSDNPRSEDAAAIISDILAGTTAGAARVRSDADRRVAIRDSIAVARAEDVVLIAGKGDETYQEIAGRKYPFSDRLEAQAALDARQTAPC